MATRCHQQWEAFSHWNARSRDRTIKIWLPAAHWVSSLSECRHWEDRPVRSQFWQWKRFCAQSLENRSNERVTVMTAPEKPQQIKFKQFQIDSRLRERQEKANTVFFPLRQSGQERANTSVPASAVEICFASLGNRECIKITYVQDASASYCFPRAPLCCVVHRLPVSTFQIQHWERNTAPRLLQGNLVFWLLYITISYVYENTSTACNNPAKPLKLEACARDVYVVLCGCSDGNM